MSSWQQCPPQKAQQQQVKQPCQPPPFKCQETCAPQTKDLWVPQARKHCPCKGTAIPAQQKCPSAQQAPKSKQK
ncbi:small proline-rich protein 4 [Equus przewalskii]|uniref:Small proline rich protein 4 n=2 Tax=Equus TaxID=9789 RepID=F7DI63_HORSE|nr:small proline-rich protein 4 [Equus caballus]